MKKIYCIFCMLLPMIASADALDDKIARLTQEKLDKLAKLEQCQKSTKGLKIAGWTTLGISAIGIAANIGEAVALNKLDDKIDVAKQTVSNLDSQIQEQQRQNELKKQPGININDTCGAQTCGAAPTQSVLDSLNATEAVCVNGAWAAKICKENFPGTASTCTLNGQVVTYIGACNPVGAVVPVTVEEKNCPEITQEWLTQNNALSGECDKTTGQLYITECTDTYTEVKDANGRITECQQNQEETQPVVQERRYHEMCTAEETAAIPNAATAWWYNGKCVAKSCKPNTYLHVKNGVSQGQCKTACPAWQITNWPNGGQACDVAKTKPEEQNSVQENCTRVQQIAVNDQSCKTQCMKFATDNKCLWNQEYLWKNDVCICTPNQTDRNTVQNIGNITPSVPVQQNNCPADFVDLKKQTAHYGYKYSPSMSNMEVWFKIGNISYRGGYVTYQDADAQTMNDPEWRKNKAKELVEKTLEEKKWCNYQLEYSANLF